MVSTLAKLTNLIIFINPIPVVAAAVLAMALSLAVITVMPVALLRQAIWVLSHVNWPLRTSLDLSHVVVSVHSPPHLSDILLPDLRLFCDTDPFVF